ncbi:hypothetical protein BC830DRAFT_1131853 [Chytriomyces sp. MP71]|nr:hypothetical protein BC830DRAFT_1131853 [Chytriomyces sp. MP71]
MLWQPASNMPRRLCLPHTAARSFRHYSHMIRHTSLLGSDSGPLSASIRSLATKSTHSPEIEPGTESNETRNNPRKEPGLSLDALLSKASVPRKPASREPLKLHDLLTSSGFTKPKTEPTNLPNSTIFEKAPLKRGSGSAAKPHFTFDSLPRSASPASQPKAEISVKSLNDLLNQVPPKRGASAVKPHFTLDVISPLRSPATPKPATATPPRLSSATPISKKPNFDSNASRKLPKDETGTKLPTDLAVAQPIEALPVEAIEDDKEDIKKLRRKDKMRDAERAEHVAKKHASKRMAKEPKKEKDKPQKVVQQPKDILLPDGISVVNMGALLGISYEKLATEMKRLGFDYPAPDYVLNTDISSLVALEFGLNPIIRKAAAAETNFKSRPPPEDWSTYPFRPPVVTIMGHVDHGKTTLLDTLRKTSVAAGEAGGITQHIGAFFVTLPSGKKITFLDTPGHAAFSAMRERGARVTDIVVLVVAADDGIMPQTIEALKFAQQAGVQIVVAVNKCDKHGAAPSKVKESLIRYGLLVEDYGGEVPAVEVSGLTGLGLDKLEETIIAISELADIRGDATGRSEATVIESRVAKGKGNVTTMLVTRGTLRPGQILVAGTSWCKVRTLTDERGKSLKEAGPSSPVEVSGWKDLPNAGDFVLEAESEALAKEVVESRVEDAKRAESMKAIEEMNLKRIKEREAAEAAKTEDAAGDKEGTPVVPEATAIPLPIVLKSDVHGSAEAIEGVLEGFPKHEVHASIISSSVGQVTDSDVELAYAVGGRVIAFNVAIDKKVQALATSRKVVIDSYNIIYKLMDDLQETMLDLLPKEEINTVLGEADVLQVFELNTKSKEQERVAGCRIMSGKILRNERIRLLRGDQIVFDGKLKTFKHHKKDIQEASKGLECGLAFEGSNDIVAGDRVSCYRIEKRRRTKLNYI